MKVTLEGITYEGTEDEIRRIVENPPNRGYPQTTIPDPGWPRQRPVPESPKPYEVPWDFPRNWDGSPRVTCTARRVTVA